MIQYIMHPTFIQLKAVFGTELVKVTPIQQITPQQKLKLIETASIVLGGQLKHYHCVAVILLAEHLKCPIDRAEQGIKMMMDHRVIGQIGSHVSVINKETDVTIYYEDRNRKIA